MLSTRKLLKRLATFSGHERGFTLIEMLVVIAIISILIGIGINTFTIAQKKARDVRRKADIRAIQTALELYKQDIGDYPPITGSIGDVSGIQTALAPYLPNLPQDPLNKNNAWEVPAGGPKYVYMYYKTGVGAYHLIAALENIEDSESCKNKAYGNVYGNINCPDNYQYPNYYMVTSQ